MATTSPDNLRTPNPGDPYNLVADLATLASDTQTALNKKVSNLLTGTAAQRVAATGTATAGMLWQDTDGIKMIWRKDGSVWVPAVWRWSGTTAQRTGFTQAPSGFEWNDTTNGLSYVRLGTAWRTQTSAFKSSASGAQAVTAGYTLITSWKTPDLPSEDVSVNTSTGVITVNNPGVYMTSVNVTTTANGVNSAVVLKNSTTVPTGSVISIQASGLTATGSSVDQFAAGDLLRVYGAGPGGSQTLSALSFISLTKLIAL